MSVFCDIVVNVQSFNGRYRDECLIEPTHSDRFLTILGGHYPTWREARAELNELPLAAEVWKK